MDNDNIVRFIMYDAAADFITFYNERVELDPERGPGRVGVASHDSLTEHDPFGYIVTFGYASTGYTYLMTDNPVYIAWRKVYYP